LFPRKGEEKPLTEAVVAAITARLIFMVAVVLCLMVLAVLLIAVRLADEEENDRKMKTVSYGSADSLNLVVVPFSR